MFGKMDVLMAAPIVLVGLLSLLALLDCVRTPRDRVRHVPKLLWLIFLLYAPVFGALVWVYTGKKPAEDTTKGPTQRVEPFAQRGSGGI